ncbi:DUF4231 domain-containing protein [uncultured Sphingomonas sp.]|uniref:DUF4231 domain-containing protein n=1 Tax=uncultured Sphingomonas sp. TaxID=158754 RepID=UPI0025D45198|nr:DUF4231 domain-containing protein [uncultured Sphingomonas sp.]
MRKGALVILEREREVFAHDPPCFTLVSPLAGGADQMAALLAVEQGWELQAVLPLPSDDCARLEPEAADRLQQLLARSRCVLELPGDPASPIDAYVMAGRATVAHCDLLIAVWDGLPARGRGGTAETVELALTRGTPILHIPPDGTAPATLLWSAFDPVVVTLPGDRACGRPATPEALRTILEAMLAPPAVDSERRFARGFLAETQRLLRWRLEYPLLMALTGTRALSRRDLSARSQIAADQAEWHAYRETCVGCHGVSASFDMLEAAYGWSDRLATHFAQIYRSSHVLNFLLAALGVWLGLSGLVLHADPALLALAEFLVVLVVVVNTITGSRRCWHQRWLDYRQLAERLRPMRSLKLLGIAAPDPPGTAAEPIAGRWIDWYSAAMWRTVGCPAGRMRREDLPTLAAAIAERELQPQIAYNRAAATQAERLDGRLEHVGLALFIATLLLTFLTIAALEFAPELIGRAGNWTTVLSAGLPALGTAIFGIRVQGDYRAAANRARHTAALLDRIARDLRGTSDLPRAADLTEQAARVMLADLGEWRLVSELHELSLG